jgi:translocation and assembly module TamB
MSEDSGQRESGQLQASHAEASGKKLRVLAWLGSAGLLIALAILGVARYVAGADFHERARLYAVAQIERVSGGRVELQRVEWNLARLQFELAGLTIHGKEAATEAPLLRAERVRVRLKWTPLLRGRVSMHELSIVRPLAHVSVYQDGSTNIPEPKLPPGTRPEQTEELLRLAMDHAELSDGLLQWNEEKIKLEGAAEEIALELHYRAEDRHYDGIAKVGQVRVQLPELERLTLGAEAEFRIYHDRVEVPRLRVSSGHSWAEAGGAVSGLASPVAQFAYRAVGDVGELARLARYRELQGGTVQLNGEGTYRWDRAEYAVVGKAQAAGVNWAERGVRLEKMNGGMVFSLDRQHFNASSIFATVLGGTVHGKMDVSKLSGEQPVGRIELEVTGVELAQALRAFSTNELPLPRLRLAGSTMGSLNANWRGSPLNARVDGDLVVHPVTRVGEVPVAAVIQATFDFKDQSVRLNSVEASTQATHLSVRGRLSAQSDLQVDVRTTNFSELAPIVTSWRGTRAKTLPIEFGGGAQFQGTVRGRLDSPVVAGHLELHDFTTVLWRWDKRDGENVPAEYAVRTRWELLDGDVEYSSTHESLRNGVLRRGSVRIGLDASVALVNGGYDATQPFSAHVKVENALASDMQGLAGTSYPVTGQVSGDVQVGGTENHLRGSGRIAVKDGSAWRQSVRLATADVNFTEDQAQLRNIVVKSDAMQLSGDARVNVAASEFGFNLKGTEVKIENLPAVRDGKLHVTGQATFEANGSGTPSAPVINGRLRLRNLAVNRQLIGDMNIEAVTHGSEMTLAARSNFKAAEVKLDGQIQLRDQLPMHVVAEVQSANLNPLLEAYLPLRNGGPSELKMHIEASGEARRPKEITANVLVERWVENYAGITVTNDGPIRLKMVNEVLTLEQFRMAGEQGTRFLQVRGQVQLGGKREIDVRADGSVNLKLLETTDLNLTAGGVANFNLQANGTLSQPSLRGRLSVQNGAIAYVDFSNGLSDITGTLNFNEDRLQVQELTARTGGGLLHCGGFITISPSQGLGFNLSANGRDIRLRYPEGLSSTANATLALTGSAKNQVLSGDITVTRLGLNPQFDFATYLVKGMRGAPAQKIDSLLNNVRLDLHVNSTPELQVQTSLARVSGNVDLRMRGTAARPIVLGRVNLLEGTISFNATKYRLERGDITFTNPVRIEPGLDVELSARVRDYDITLGFHGPINKLTPSYRSDPPLSSSDIISLLALGRTAGETANPAMIGTSQYQPTVSESASGALIGQALNSTMNSRVQRLFGVSRLKIDPNVGGALNAGLARVTVEQTVSNKLTLTYITNLNQSAQQIIQFEYNVNNNVSIVGVRDQTGVVSFDVLLRKRKK